MCLLKKIEGLSGVFQISIAVKETDCFSLLSSLKTHDPSLKQSTPSLAVLLLFYFKCINPRNVFMFTQVKIFVGATQSYAANDSNVRVFKDDKFAAMYREMQASGGHSMKTTDIRDELRALLKVQSVYCDEMLNDTELIRDISHADAVVGELLYLCSSLVADKLSLPHVILSASTLSTPTDVALGLPSPLSYVPQVAVPLTNELKFVDRIKNVLQWMSLYHFYIYDLCPSFNEIKTKHNITPDKTIQETLSRVDLIIGQMDFTLEHPRPLLPSKERYR